MKNLVLAVAALFALSCTLPRILILDDPLSAAQHNELGFIYEGQGKYDLAEKEYGRALQKQNGWAVPYFNLGNVHIKRGDLKGAETCYRKALERDPDNPDIMNNLAYVLSEQGEHEKAETWIDQAIRLSPKAEYLDTQRRIERKKSAPPSRQP